MSFRTFSPPQRSRRWFFVTLTLLAILFLGLTLRAFLLDADLSLGLSRISGPGLPGLIVNRRSYTPPADSILTPSQLGLLLHLALHIDSLLEQKKSAKEVREHFAEILNRYTTSLSEYRWIRSTTTMYQITGIGLGSPRADSVNQLRLRQVLPKLKELRHFLRDSLDKEAL